MRLLLFNLATDPADPVLGFGCVWIRELARHCEAIDVLTMYRGEIDFPGNVRVYSAGRERGWCKARRLAQFYRHLTRLLATRRYDACFAHMMPLFAALGGPLLRARAVPIVLWYAHRQPTIQLRLGLAMTWRAVTSVRTSFPLETDKLRVIGQGIDTDFYRPMPPSPTLVPPVTPPRPSGGVPQGGKGVHRTLSGTGAETQPQVLQVARLAAVKHQATTIKAVALTDARLTLVGGVQAGYPIAYQRELQDLSAALGIQDRCAFTGDLPADEVREWNRRATIAVNTSPVGLFDKSALESMACGLPTVVCNPAFAPLLGDYRDLLLIDGPDDVDGLRDRLERLLALPAAERARIGQTLREGVQREHSLARLIERLLAVLETGELPR